MRIEDVEKASGLKNQLTFLERDLKFLKENREYLLIDIIDRRSVTKRNGCAVNDKSPALAEFFDKYQKELEDKIEEIKKQIEAL